ncbi:MAG TPA: hypothetical protein P5149_15820 [Candidatus Competibacteraceae bacterium]|nr:hypothetical protein [Candidatus Competibacteraceae bacterium]HPF60390.1 hypothetical protein [Candidatus Competibacteraceae bacterium]HRY19854.1 hypothetical protein [Candidatus Competibacteraceae bacterium]
MKLTTPFLIISAFLILPTAVLADDETRSGFDDKGRDHAAHVEVHVHEHPEVRDASAKPEPFKNQGADVVKETEVHAHEHPEVRDAPGKPEPFKGK